MIAKVFNTDQICAINTNANKEQRNRILADELIAKLDPFGWHVSSFWFLHNTFEIRCNLLVKVIDSDNPVEVWLDMNHKEFESAKTFQESE
jgi:hypothetical protein